MSCSAAEICPRHVKRRRRPSAVSQFRELCEIADRDRSLTDTLKKVLKLSKGWETAREHVYKAVDTDNRMRCARLPARKAPWVLSC